MKLETNAVFHLIRERITIDAMSSVVGKFCKIVSLKLDAIELFNTAKFLHLCLSFRLRQWVLTILIGGEFAEKFFGRNALAPLLLRSETLGNGEERHDGLMLDVIELHLIKDFKSVAQSLRHISKYLVHLLFCLEPLLLAIKHT